MIADASFDCKAPGDRIAKDPDHPVNFMRLAQQSAARAFSANRRARAAEVEIESSDRVLLQLSDRIDHVSWFGTDNLRKDRSIGAVLIDRAENVAIWSECMVHAKELGDKPIGATSACANPHEREVRDALHWCKNQSRSIMRKEVAHVNESGVVVAGDAGARAYPEMMGNPRLIWRG